EITRSRDLREHRACAGIEPASYGRTHFSCKPRPGGETTMKTQTSIDTGGHAVLVCLVLGAISLWCVAAGGAANIVNGSADSGGQANACTVDRQSSVAPSLGVQGVQIASNSCEAAAPPS